MNYNYKTITIILLFFSQTILAQNYVFVEIPGWVTKIDIPNESSFSKYDIMSGYYLTVADYQINLEEEAVFNHEVINVVSYSGITNASQLAVTYDTNYQELQIHHLNIWRKGKKIDRTNDLSFEIMNTEYSLHQGIYTGKITAYDILNDVRKDDLIDFAYTLVGDNPIFNDEKYLLIPMGMMNPVDLFSVRILYQKEKDYIYECKDCDSINFSNSVIDNYKIIEIMDENVKAIEIEDYTPTWLIPYKYVTLSSIHSWVDVNNWAQRVFSLKKEPELNIVFNEIFTGEETTDDKINSIIDYVQDDIRYMGIESGIGSIKPFSPEQVVDQRFGDCKDKSLLLVSLLKKIGIEKAYPVLVNNIMQHNVDILYPSNQVFNHSIVRFDYNDTTYWVDPSVAQQGGTFRDLYTFDYGKVLIIGMPSDTLHNMSQKKPETVTKIIEEMTINSFTEPSTLNITSERYGFAADQRRVLMEYYTTKDITDLVTNDLKLLFPVVNLIEDIKISDDMESNHFLMTYKYEVEGFWEDIDTGTEEVPEPYRMFKYSPVMIHQYMNEPVCDDREFDYQLNYPMNLIYSVIFHFPEDLFIQDDIDIFDNEAFYYEEKVEQISSNSLQIDYTLRTKSKYIKAKNYKEICDQKKSIAKDLQVTIFFPK